MPSRRQGGYCSVEQHRAGGSNVYLEPLIIYSYGCWSSRHEAWSSMEEKEMAMVRKCYTLLPFLMVINIVSSWAIGVFFYCILIFQLICLNLYWSYDWFMNTALKKIKSTQINLSLILRTSPLYSGITIPRSGWIASKIVRTSNNSKLKRQIILYHVCIFWFMFQQLEPWKTNNFLSRAYHTCISASKKNNSNKIEDVTEKRALES